VHINAAGNDIFPGCVQDGLGLTVQIPANRRNGFTLNIHISDRSIARPYDKSVPDQERHGIDNIFGSYG
jgi:hypothetical protein